MQPKQMVSQAGNYGEGVGSTPVLGLSGCSTFSPSYLTAFLPLGR